MVKKFFLPIIILLSVIDLFAQNPDIAYIIPDIGAPGLNTYMEIIAPYDAIQTFGNDGLYLNLPTDAVHIQLLQSADESKVTFGPLIVSWQGRMISTQVFVHPDQQPNDFVWDQLDPEFRIQFRVLVNGQPSNAVELYIVKPYNLGDISNNPERVLGAGSLGSRSKRGAMIVDSIKFANADYTVSLTDPEPWESGNQAYLPFILLSKGKIEGGTNTRIIVDGTTRHAGPGGGGGGGRFCDKVAGSGGESGGDGYTGGGPGGTNRKFGGGDYRNEGVGTYSNGDALNKNPGGKRAEGLWETAPGGTGHPFGQSGLACNEGYICNPIGQYGGGSGASQNRPGGSGGYGSDGSNSSGSNGGKAHGNEMIIPLAGGSGGSSGNPNLVSISDYCAGDGGGGGGAIAVFGSEVKNIQLSAKGGDGGADSYSGAAHGGGGSGGANAIGSKLPFENINLSVPGGNGGPSWGGGAGRLRYDTPSFLGIFNALPSNASRYRGITTDTSRYAKRSFTLTGSRNSSETVRLFLKAQSGVWSEVSGLSYAGSDFSSNLLLPAPDSLFFVVAIQSVTNPLAGEFNDEPEFVMSQSAANTLIVDAFPIIYSDTIRNLRAIDCDGITLFDTVKIFNTGDAVLSLDFSKATLTGDPGFEIVKPLSVTNVPGIYSDDVIIKYSAPKGTRGPVTGTLRIPHNDYRGRKNPWTITFSINIDTIKIICWDDISNSECKSITLGTICPNSDVASVFKIKNKSSIRINLLDPFVIYDQSKFDVSIIGNRSLNPEEFSSISIKFKGEDSPINTFITAVVVWSEECPEYKDTINVVVNIKRPNIVMTGNTQFPPTKLGLSSTTTLTFRNNGTASTYISQLPQVQPPFSVVGSVPPIPPPLMLAPGGTLDITFKFEPTSAEDYQEDTELLGIEVDSACSTSYPFSLNGSGIKSNVIVMWDSVYFGILANCDEVQDSIVIVNTGQAELTLLSADIVGADALNFSIAQGPVIPWVLSSGKSAVFYIRFNAEPGNDGLKAASLVIKTDDIENETLDIKLRGIRTSLRMGTDPLIVDFGRIPIGVVNNRTLKLRNLSLVGWHLNNALSSNPDISVTPPATQFDFDTMIDFNILANLNQEGVFNDSLMFIFDTPCPDTLYVIVKGEGLAAKLVIDDSLFFGELAFCETNILSVNISNIGKWPLHVEKMEIIGADATLFVFGNNTFPDSLNPTESISQEIIFDASSSDYGTKEAFCKVTIHLNGKTIDTLVKLTGIKSQGLLTYISPQFLGRASVGSFKDFNISLTNNWSKAITIRRIGVPSNSTIFSLTNSPFYLTLQPSRSFDLIIRFQAPDLGIFSDSIELYLTYSSCDDSSSLLFSAEGITGDSVRVWFPYDTLVNPGTRNFVLPIYVQRIYSGETISNQPFKTSVRFDSGIFLPFEVTNGSITTNSIETNGDRLLTIEGTVNQITDKPLAITGIIGHLLLGERDRTPLRFDSFVWENDFDIGYTLLESGLLRLDICRDGGDRLLSHGEPLSLKIEQNDLQSNVRFILNTLEKGRHQLEIININGQTVAIEDWIAESGEQRSFELGHSISIPTGIYFAILKSPTSRIINNFYIIQ